MRKVLPSGLLSSFLLLITINIYAQQDQFAYAITPLAKDGKTWQALRKLNLNTGEYSDVLFDGLDMKNMPYDAQTKQQIFESDPVNPKLPQLPFNTGVAALALDKKHNRLFFTPMFLNQLRYLDLTSMKVFCVTNQGFTTTKKEQMGPGKTVSRMVITPDGEGYGISNDASEFVQFTTGKQPSIKQLGALVDAPENKTISIHNSCTSYGGDIVADDQGALYLVSGVNNVFKIDPSTKIAKHLGMIQGLPAGFTTSAVVVTSDGQLLISSSVTKGANYLVNTKTWKAILFQTNGIVYNTSDLANSNYLSTKKARFDILKPIASNLSQNIQIYPNPVVEDVKFTVKFSDVPPGNYVVELLDLNGRRIMKNRITISSETATQNMPINPAHAKGLYLVRVINMAKKSVFEQKLLVQ